MTPKIKCPNCQQNEWLEYKELSYLPKIMKRDDGTYATDIDNGIHIRIWRCNNCMYVMHFWEPD
jgi:hypothetical protein